MLKKAIRRISSNRIFFTAILLDILGTILLASSTQILPSTVAYGTHMELGGKEVGFASIVQVRFWGGLALLAAGTLLTALDRFLSSEGTPPPSQLSQKTQWYCERVAGIVLMIILVLLAFIILPHMAPCLGTLWQKLRPTDKYTFAAKVYPWYLMGLVYCLYENREYPASPWQAYFFSLPIRGVVATMFISGLSGGAALKLGMTIGEAYAVAAATAFYYGWKKSIPEPKTPGSS